jgi:hypothetical protein
MAHAFKLPPALSPGVKFCSSSLLRAGIVCVGAKLSLLELLRFGALGLPVVAAAMAVGGAFIVGANRLLGLPPKIGLLTAAGTTVCGVTAVLATAPAIGANQQEISYAVANVRRPPAGAAVANGSGDGLLLAASGCFCRISPPACPLARPPARPPVPHALFRAGGGVWPFRHAGLSVSGARGVRLF